MAASEIAREVRDGTRRAQDVAAAFLSRISEVDERVGAFIEVDSDDAMRAAEQIDAARARGDELGPLAGVPVAVKDVFARRGKLATCASRILEGFRAPYTATAVARLERAGAVMLGRTNMDEFAMGSSTEHSAYGVTRNPFDLSRTPGGSSGGSAAAVAARMAPLALGSDTGGSVRQPAALCGVPGLKPTYGRVSRHGLIAFASSLDHVAPFGRTVEDLATALAVMAGLDPLDSTSLAAAVPDYLPTTSDSVEGLRIGVPAEYFDQDLHPEVTRATREAIATLESLGARVVDIELPHTRFAIPAYYLIANSEASSNLARYDGVEFGARRSGGADLGSMYEDTRTAGFGDEVKLRILLGTFCLCSGYYDDYYLAATRVRTLIRRDFERAFEGCDVIATPTTPTPAFSLGEKTDDPLQMYLCDVLTTPANLAGIPGISIPSGVSQDGMPIGLQLLGPVLGEQALFRAAGAYQRATQHHLLEPAL